jgi:predicted SprT family Zn-dependent metalloprotease
MDLHAARRTARELMDRHGLNAWTLRFDGAKQRAGLCRHDRREISLSAPLVSLYSEDEVRETVLHEIAHALVGARHGHDAVWRATAVRIGASGRRLVREDAPRVDGDWAGMCPAGHRVTRHRRPGRPQSCATCSPTFDTRFLLSWTHRGVPVPGLSGLPDGGSGAGTSSSAAPDPRSVRPGDRLRVAVPGRFEGVVGVVVKRARTRYHLRIDGGVLTVPFACVERPS